MDIKFIEYTEQQYHIEECELRFSSVLYQLEHILPPQYTIINIERQLTTDIFFLLTLQDQTVLTFRKNDLQSVEGPHAAAFKAFYKAQGGIDTFGMLTDVMHQSEPFFFIEPHLFMNQSILQKKQEVQTGYIQELEKSLVRLIAVNTVEIALQEVQSLADKYDPGFRLICSDTDPEVRNILPEQQAPLPPANVLPIRQRTGGLSREALKPWLAALQEVLTDRFRIEKVILIQGTQQFIVRLQEQTDIVLDQSGQRIGCINGPLAGEVDKQIMADHDTRMEDIHYKTLDNYWKWSHADASGFSPDKDPFLRICNLLDRLSDFNDHAGLLECLEKALNNVLVSHQKRVAFKRQKGNVLQCRSGKLTEKGSGHTPELFTGSFS